MAGIFISYRRDDAAGEAGRLYDRLQARFGAQRVFRDVDALRAGEAFPAEIEERLAECDVLIALMGERWSGEGGPGGSSRLHDPDDFVRLEIAAALERGIPVIPTLLDDTPIPDAGDLPPELRPLTRRHAFELDTTDFHDDVTRLIRVLETHVEPDGPVRRLWRRTGVRRVTTGLGLAAVVAAGVLLWGRGSGVDLRSEPGIFSTGQVRALLVERGFYSAASNPGGPGVGAAYASRTEGGAPVVEDRATDLVWQQGGSGRLVSGGRVGAESYVDELNRTRHAGHADWRLPTLDEALSLMRPDAARGYHLDPLFDAVSAPFVWSSDAWRPEGPGGPEPGSGERGWVVYYRDGIAAPESAVFNAYVRAVRGR